MSLARKILYSIGAVILLLVVFGVFLPSTAHVERKTTIHAHPATVFAQINDVHRMTEWLPWFETDSQARVSFSGPAMGVGAILRWDNDDNGGGTWKIVESRPFEKVTVRVEQDGEPAEMTFRLRQVDRGVEVLWQFDIDFGNDLSGRYSALFLDQRVGLDYAQGLANLKTIAESLPRADFSNLQIERTVVDPIEIAYRTTSSQPNAAAVSEALGKAFFDILEFMNRHGLKEAGAPLSISRGFNGSELVFDAAIPVRGVTGETPRSGLSATGVKLGMTYGGPVLRAKHVGSYRNLRRTHEKIAAYLAAHGIERNGDAWESYVSDPTRTAEPELLTYLYYPIVSPGKIVRGQVRGQ